VAKVTSILDHGPECRKYCTTKVKVLHYKSKNIALQEVPLSSEALSRASEALSESYIYERLLELETVYSSTDSLNRCPYSFIVCLY
jgi:hypothetical protein